MNLLRTITSGFADEFFNCTAAIIILISGYAQQRQELKEVGHSEVVMLVISKQKTKISRGKAIRQSMFKRQTRGEQIWSFNHKADSLVCDPVYIEQRRVVDSIYHDLLHRTAHNGYVIAR